MRRYLLGCMLLLTSFGAAQVLAQVNARMLRNPDVSRTHIAFVYAGDIWVVAKAGGTASKLSSPAGEESFPRFSPDGTQIAFSGNYDGNTDIYVMPAMGGLPKRLTHHPMPDRMIDWYPDGQSILFASAMQSGNTRFNQFYKVGKEGGLPEKLPLPFGEFAAISSDGKSLAFQYISRDFRTWKRYRGGMAPDIWLFDLQNFKSRNLTSNGANDAQPMWHGNTLYFLSDRDSNMRYNLWALDMSSGATRQLTKFTDFDVHFPAIGPEEIVFEAGGRLYLLSLAGEQYREVNVDVITDLTTLKPASKNVSDLIQSATISPSGKRALFEARGEIFSVPAEHGVIRNLTASPAAAERYPAWSPDGAKIAYFSDRSGEYELTLRNADGSGNEQKLSSFGAGFRYQPVWAPDSKRLAFIDQTLTLQVFDVAARKSTAADKMNWLTHGGLSSFSISWSGDGRWLAYSKLVDNQNGAIFLYDTQANAVHQVTSGFYADAQPVFDPDGNYLYFLTNRSFSPSYSDVDASWVYVNTTNIAAVPLRADVAYPLAPRNDEETGAAKKDEGEKKEEAASEGGKKPVQIELAGFEQRVQVLPPKAGNYTRLAAVPGKVLYHRLPRTGSDDEKRAIVYYDLKEREEKSIIDDADWYELAADGKKLLVRKRNNFAIIDVQPGQKLDKPLRTGELEATIDPKAEWRQLFTDAWRLMRDYFYDPNMHGVDWAAMRKQYGAMLDDAVTRWDVNYVIGELIAELNASHAYRFGGDQESAPRRPVGLLGADFTLHNGAFRIERILDGGNWDDEVRSPLQRAGVRAGEYLLAVNGEPLEISKDPWAALQGLAGKTVTLTINSSPSMDGARQVLVETLDSEVRLRNLAWIEANRKRVEEASNGRVGYIYVPNTGISGQTELVRQFHGQFHKDGLIIDERFNAGGQYPDRFIELMSRRRTGYIGFRDSRPAAMSQTSRTGRQVMLINAWAGSGGDLFPYLFKEADLGPLIGTRTWGGLIGISGVPLLIDGGGITVPNLALYGPDGNWLIEGHGVEPDIEVIEDFEQLARGRDNQLERAITETLRLLEEQPPVFTPKPTFDDRTARGRKTNTSSR